MSRKICSWIDLLNAERVSLQKNKFFTYWQPYYVVFPHTNKGMIRKLGTIGAPCTDYEDE